MGTPMATLNDRLWTATGSFGLESGCDMVKKAWREHQRCLHADTSDDRRDAAINCAITAWHLTDWIWTGMARTCASRPEVATLLGVSGRLPTKVDFIKWAVRKCPELEICQSICNGSKHVACVDLDDTRMAAPDPNERRPGRQLVARIEIVDDGRTRDAIEVLGRVIDFWTWQVTNEYVIL
jgi:hypothetical protein